MLRNPVRRNEFQRRGRHLRQEGPAAARLDVRLGKHDERFLGMNRPALLSIRSGYDVTFTSRPNRSQPGQPRRRRLTFVVADERIEGRKIHSSGHVYRVQRPQGRLSKRSGS